MIKLTNTVGMCVWVNPDHITFFIDHQHGGTMVQFATPGMVERFKETPDEIAMKIRNIR